MNQGIVPTLVRYSERAFSFSFIAFSFVMFSCWFPTGFSATFSTFAFIFALPIFFYRFNLVEFSILEKSGLILFGWLLLSVAWSDASVLDSLGFLSEYRIYFMLPVFIAALKANRKTQRWALISAIVGAVIALVTSYGLGFGWWQIEGAHLSLANRIYHGFIMSTLLLASLLAARNTSGWIRSGAATLAVLVIYNVLNVETGRTGYLQVVGVCFAFVILTFTKWRAVLAIVFSACLFVGSYLSFENFRNGLWTTLENVEQMVLNDNYHSSSGYRLEYYKGAIDIGTEYPMTGVGIGDAEVVLRERAESGAMRLLTDNVHSEFMNMLIVGGIPALLLFSGFVGSIVYMGISTRGKSQLTGDALVVVGVILSLSAAFNSTIKDYGEKHALMIMLALLASRLVGRTHCKLT